MMKSRVSKLLVLILVLLLASPSAAQIGYSVQGGGGGTTQSQVAGSSAPNADTDPLAFGKYIFAGTGARGAFGYLDTISTRAIGPFFRLDENNYVAVLGSDLDANVDIYRTTNGGVSWGGQTTVAVVIAGGINGGIVGSAASYFGKAQTVFRTVDYTVFAAIDLSSLLSLAVPASWARSPTRLHFTADGAAGGDLHVCRSTDLNPTVVGHFSCQNFPTGGAGTGAGGNFRGGQSLVFVPGTTGTLLALDNPNNTAVANVYRSTNDGATWSFVQTLTATNRPSTTEPAHGITCHATGSLCIAATGTHIYTSTNQGATWTERLGPDTAGNLHGVVTFEEEPDIILALRTGCTGLNQAMGMRSPDAGVSWYPVFMGRCSVTTGRSINSVHSSNGKFLAALSSQAAFLAFQGAIYGTNATQGNATEWGETRVTFSSLGQHIGQQATYSAGLTVETVTAAGTGIFASICGSATKVIRVKSFEMNGSVATAATRSTVILTKTSTATSGGTATTLTQAFHDSRNAAGSATLVNFYTVLATTGTSVGVVGLRTKIFPITATVAATDEIPQMVFDFAGLDVEPVYLRAVTECVQANFATTTTNAPTLTVRWKWTEE
jgi:hypothetical protein